VYIRQDGVGHALAGKYDGPYRVLVAGAKYFQVAVGERQEVVSVDRLNQPAIPPPPQPAQAILVRDWGSAAGQGVV
jgi:hypothetical protein